jgi:hypothetical protein
VPKGATLGRRNTHPMLNQYFKVHSICLYFPPTAAGTLADDAYRCQWSFQMIIIKEDSYLIKPY